MKVQIDKIKFKNILSYGNSFTEYSFEQGLIAITGKNGHGKSSFLDILSFALYGQPYRKIKIAELINRTNNKGMVVEVYFNIEGNYYRIIRGLKPNILKIYKNDSELELLSSKALIQDDINEIVGIDYLLFKQIIALAVNANKPFLTLSAYEKRKIVDTIFNINVFGDMSKTIKKTVADLKVDIKIKTTEFNDSYLYLSTVEKRFSELKKTKSTFDIDKKRDIDLVVDNISSLETKIDSVNENIRIGVETQNKIIVESITDESKMINDLSQEIGILKFKVKTAKKDIEYFNTNETCKVCKTDITDEHKEKHVSSLNAEILSDSTEIKIKDLKIEDITIIIDKQNKNRKDKQKLIRLIESQQNKLHVHKIDLDNNKKMLKSATARTFSVDIDEYEVEVIEKRRIYEILKEEVDTIQHNLDVNNLMHDVISENGVKSHFMKKLLPLLNTKITKYLDDFEMPFLFTFDELLNENIISVSTGKSGDTNYYSCSEGEKKKFDLSILLSFIDIIKSISNWSCNIMFFDELLDSAVDPSSLVLILQTIKKITVDNESSTYIISHRAYDGGIFDKVMKIEKSAGFSSIKDN